MAAVSLALLAGSLAIYGVSTAIFNVNTLTLRQTVTPDRLLGRMNASYRLLLFGMIPLGALLGGVIGLAGPIAWLAFSPVFRLRDMPAGPLETTPTRHDSNGRNP